MRILVMSDCHGAVNAARTALMDQQDAKEVIFLGDGAGEIYRISALFPEKNFHIVRGNCDFSAPFPDSLLLEFRGKRIFACHGHLFGVKGGLSGYIDEARTKKADIALFGHTHRGLTRYEDGLYLMNPGSLTRVGEHSYGIIDITDGGIFTNVIHL